MIRLCLWVAVTGGILFSLEASLYARPELICAALFIFLLLTMLVLQIYLLSAGVLRWRKKTKLWLMPAIVCAAAICFPLYLGSTVGQHISDFLFRRHFGEYVKIVTAFHDGSLTCAMSCNGDIGVVETANLPTDIHQVYGMHCKGGGVFMLFRQGTDVPLLHAGYLFRDYAETSDCSERFGSHGIVWSHVPFVRKLDEHWYRFSDQPGF